MKASDLIDELYSIIQDSGEDVEIDEYWIRVITGIDIQKYIERLGKPTLVALGDGNDNTGTSVR
jgi:hypothetical protein